MTSGTFEQCYQLWNEKKFDITFLMALLQIFDAFSCNA